LRQKILSASQSVPIGERETEVVRLVPVPALAHAEVRLQETVAADHAADVAAAVVVRKEGTLDERAGAKQLRPNGQMRPLERSSVFGSEHVLPPATR
jgi:hypothetical protein